MLQRNAITYVCQSENNLIVHTCERQLQGSIYIYAHCETDIKYILELANCSLTWWGLKCETGLRQYVSDEPPRYALQSQWVSLVPCKPPGSSIQSTMKAIDQFFWVNSKVIVASIVCSASDLCFKVCMSESHPGPSVAVSCWFTDLHCNVWAIGAASVREENALHCCPLRGWTCCWCGEKNQCCDALTKPN